MPIDLLLESSQVEILAGRDTLVIETEVAIKTGDTLQIAGVKVEATRVMPLSEFGRFNWEVWFRGEASQELRKRLRRIVPRA